MVRRAGKIKKRTISCFFLIPCLLFSIVFPARAYVLQGPHLLLLMTKNLGSASSLVVHQRILIYNDTDPNVQAEVPETLTFSFSNAFRSESKSPRLNRIHVEALNSAVTILDDKVSIQGETLFDRYIAPLLFHSRILLQKKLSNSGINPMVSSLGRFDGVPVYVIGSHYPDMLQPQLWLDKETFRPVRLLIPDPDGQGGIPGLEFRYLKWQKNRKLWYPMRIQCYQNDRLIREMIVEEIIMNPLIPDNVFDIDGLRAQYEPTDVPGNETPSAEVPSDIQRTLDDFKKRYEE